MVTRLDQIKASPMHDMRCECGRRAAHRSAVRTRPSPRTECFVARGSPRAWKSAKSAGSSHAGGAECSAPSALPRCAGEQHPSHRSTRHAGPSSRTPWGGAPKAKSCKTEDKKA